jgi:hypothetical protein
VTGAGLYALALLAVFRVTRLITRDHLTDTPRRWVQARVPEMVAYLIGCSWCASVWAGAGVGVAVVWWPTNRVVLVVLFALAASAVAGLLSTLDPWEDAGEVLPDGGAGS